MDTEIKAKSSQGRQAEGTPSTQDNLNHSIPAQKIKAIIASDPVRFFSQFCQDIKRAGKGWSSHCPLHDDQHASFVFFEDGGAKCFACGWSGDALSFIAKLHGLNIRTQFADVLKIAAEAVGINIQRRVSERKIGQTLKDRYDRAKSAWEVTSAAAYLQSKGISRATVEKLGLRADSEYIIYPHHDGYFRAHAHGFNPSRKSLWDHGVSVGLYGAPNGEERLIITEGEPDTWKMIDEGFSNVVAIPGASITKPILDQLADLKSKYNLYYFPDFDKPGLKAAESLRKIGVKVVEWYRHVPKLNNQAVPDNHGKDISDFFIELGGTKASLERIIQESLLPWKPLSMADAYQDRPPIEYLVYGILERGALIIIYGGPGDLKTFLIQDMVGNILIGTEWLAGLPGEVFFNVSTPGYKTVKTPIVWFDFDNGQRRILDRFSAIGKAYNIPTDAPLFIYSMPQPWLNADRADSIALLIETIKHHKAGLVVIDNLGNVTGDTEENSADMGKVLSNFRQVIETTGTSIILIHHQRKMQPIKARSGDKLRGHGSIEAALDLALLVERDEDIITVKSTKTRGVDVKPFSARFTYEHKPETKDLLSARFFGYTAQSVNTKEEIENEIIEFLSISPGVKNCELVNGVRETIPGASVHKIRQCISELVSSRKIRETVGNKGAKRYEKI
ncbi:AAA family ATPase [bacterium]|nr:AAA family ATPase [bacterium]